MARTVGALVAAIALALSGDALAAGDRFAADLEFLDQHDARLQAAGHRASPAVPPSTSAAVLLATGLIRLYQATLSGQDVGVCRFTPSCSRFAAEAIRRGGLIRGVLLGADRVTRCHEFSRGHERGGGVGGPGAGAIPDPVDWYLP